MFGVKVDVIKEEEIKYLIEIVNVYFGVVYMFINNVGL